MSSLSATFLPAEPDNARPETEPRSKDSSRSDRDRVGYLPSLDGWRAIAISAVLLDHSAVLPWRFARHHLQNKGADGVWLFFAISGLLICSRLLNEEKRNGKISLPNFYIRRSFRIFPASFTFLAILLGLEALKIIPLNHSAWLSALLFCRNYWSYFMQSGDSGTWFTSHFWSLAVEEHFYLFFQRCWCFSLAHDTPLLQLSRLFSSAGASSTWRLTHQLRVISSGTNAQSFACLVFSSLRFAPSS